MPKLIFTKVIKKNTYCGGRLSLIGNYRVQIPPFPLLKIKIVKKKNKNKNKHLGLTWIHF